MTTENAEPQGWRPEDNETLTGRVVALDKGWSDYANGFYPIVTLETEDGRMVNVHCFHAVLQKRMLAVSPGIGDKISVTHHGKRATKDGKREVTVYTVKSDKPQDATTFWQGMGASHPNRDAVAADVPIAMPEDDEPIPF